MAHLRKVGSGWQLQYYLNGRKLVKQFPEEVPKAVVEAERKRIESELALHKAGLKRFGEDPRAAEFLTLHDLTESVLNSRQHEVTKETIARNRHAMKLFLAVIGKHTLVSDLKPTHFDKFRHARFEAMQKLYRARGWTWNEDRVKRGVNKDLENIRCVLRLAVKKNFIPPQYLPKIEKLKVDRRRLPSFLNKEEVQQIAAQLEGEARLAFWLIRYTGARRSEIARKFLGDERGLKWQDIDWTRNTIRLYAKKKERLVPMHPKLREMLLERKNEIGEQAQPEAHVISLVRDTLSDYFARVRKRASTSPARFTFFVILPQPPCSNPAQTFARFRRFWDTVPSRSRKSTRTLCKRNSKARSRARLHESINSRSNVMAKLFELPEERTLYLNELEQLEQSLRALRQRVSEARRAIKQDRWIHLAHVRAAQSVNAALIALVEVWQPTYQNKPTLHQSL